MSDHIADVVVNLAYRFRALNLEPPETIILSSHEDGMRVLGEFERKFSDCNLVTNSINRVVPAIVHRDGSAWMELKFFGIGIRWPAEPRPREG